jgi:signal transduction histidine kinase
VTIVREPDSARVHVDDAGPGIDPDVRERLFEPFFTTRHQGTGLGLPIVKRDVEAHGGQVSIAEAPGGGTRVTVSLPRVQRDPD